ncbi:hypothetical protein ABT297_10750, partial [Dactylosporangium sp. NPDC000555]|uniref:hypothetical protein n=1 Tax=Dactylosporangium sp. NPDC000555 TaxID=3154260 RepID=UPI00331EA08D
TAVEATEDSQDDAAEEPAAEAEEASDVEPTEDSAEDAAAEADEAQEETAEEPGAEAVEDTADELVEAIEAEVDNTEDQGPAEEVNLVADIGEVTGEADEAGATDEDATGEPQAEAADEHDAADEPQAEAADDEGEAEDVAEEPEAEAEDATEEPEAEAADEHDAADEPEAEADAEDEDQEVLALVGDVGGAEGGEAEDAEPVAIVVVEEDEDDELEYAAVAAPLRPGDIVEQRIVLWKRKRADKFRQQLVKAQSKFVDDPVKAVARASAVVSDAIETLAEKLEEQQHALNPATSSERPDTEALRVAMRQYKDFLERLLSL